MLGLVRFNKTVQFDFKLFNFVVCLIDYCRPINIAEKWQKMFAFMHTFKFIIFCRPYILIL